MNTDRPELVTGRFYFGHEQGPFDRLRMKNISSDCPIAETEAPTEVGR